MRNDFSIVIAGLVVSLVNGALCSSAELEWGTLKGRVVVEGTVPTLKPLIVKGAGDVRDAKVCAAQDIPDEKYVIDLESNGLANVAIFLPRKPAKIHPNLEQKVKLAEADPVKKQPVDEVKLEQKGCQFVPHVLFVQVGQTMRVLNRDPIAHNCHSFPVKNIQMNFITMPMDPNGVSMQPIKVSERIPFKISCDIHPWMSAYCVALDHPYCAITDETGRFEIPKLPAGRHDFAVWHESTGFIERQYIVTIDKEVNEQEPFTVEIQ